MKKFEFEINNSTKTLFIIVRGVYSSEDGVAFVEEYMRNVSKINTKEYILKLNCLNLDITPGGVMPQLRGCFELYKKNDFKKVIMVLPSAKDKAFTSNVLRAQFNKLAEVVGLNNLELINE